MLLERPPKHNIFLKNYKKGWEVINKTEGCFMTNYLVSVCLKVYYRLSDYF